MDPKTFPIRKSEPHSPSLNLDSQCKLNCLIRLFKDSGSLQSMAKTIFLFEQKSSGVHANQAVYPIF